MRKIMLSALLGVICLVAQEFRATLNGIVQDTSGSVAPGARIEVTNIETGVVQQTTSLSQGEFTVPFMRPGTYTVSAELTGFKKVLRENIVLRQSQALSVTLTLEPGTITVTCFVSEKEGFARDPG